MKPSVPRSRLCRLWPALAAWLLAGPATTALLASGCSTDVSTYRDYALKSSQASCERSFRCCAKRCSTSADTTFNSSLKNTQFAIDSGLLQFSAAQAQACLDAMTSLYTDCSQIVDTVDTSGVNLACTGILQGTLPVGVGCSQTSDYCAPNSFCSLDTSYNPPEARCRRMIAVDQPCVSGDRCVAGSSCSSATPRVCTKNTVPGALGATCDAMTPCGSALVCLPDSTCGVPQDGGKSCTNDTQCLSSRCAVDTCTVPMTKPTTVSDLLCGSTSSI